MNFLKNQIYSKLKLTHQKYSKAKLCKEVEEKHPRTKVKWSADQVAWK